MKRYNGMVWAILALTLGFIHSARADNSWKTSGYKPSDNQFRHFVGISPPEHSEARAIAEARRLVMVELVRALSDRATIAVTTAESTSAVVVKDNSDAIAENVDIGSLELVDQVIERRDGEIETGLYVARSLYRYPLAKLKAERERLGRDAKPASTPEDALKDLPVELQREKARQTALEAERAHRAESYNTAFPRLALDATFGMTFLQNEYFLTASPGFRVRLIEPLDIGARMVWGVGSNERVVQESPDKNYNKADHLDSDSLFTYGLNARIYVHRSAHSGFYLYGEHLIETLRFTCDKTRDGTCVALNRPDQTLHSNTVGIGFVRDAGFPVYLQVGYGVEDRRVDLGIGFSVPLWK